MFNINSLDNSIKSVNIVNIGARGVGARDERRINHDFIAQNANPQNTESTDMSEQNQPAKNKKERVLITDIKYEKIDEANFDKFMNHPVIGGRFRAILSFVLGSIYMQARDKSSKLVISMPSWFTDEDKKEAYELYSDIINNNLKKIEFNKLSPGLKAFLIKIFNKFNDNTFCYIQSNRTGQPDKPPSIDGVIEFCGMYKESLMEAYFKKFGVSSFNMVYAGKDPQKAKEDLKYILLGMHSFGGDYTLAQETQFGHMLNMSKGTESEFFKPDKSAFADMGVNADDSVLLMNKKTGEKIIIKKSCLIEKGKKAESLLSKLLITPNYLGDMWSEMIVDECGKNEFGEALIEADKKFSKKYGEGANVISEAVRCVFFSGFEKQNLPKMDFSAENQFKYSLFAIMKFCLENQKPELNLTINRLMITPSLFLDMSFVEGEVTPLNMHTSLSKASKLKFLHKTKSGEIKELLVDTASPSLLVLKEIGDRLADMEKCKDAIDVQSDVLLARAKDMGSIEVLATDALSGAFEGLLIKTNMVKLECMANPFLGPLFFANLATPEGMRAFTDEFVNVMEKGSEKDIAVYMSFNILMGKDIGKKALERGELGIDMAKYGVSCTKSLALFIKDGKMFVEADGKRTANPVVINAVLTMIAGKWGEQGEIKLTKAEEASAKILHVNANTLPPAGENPLARFNRPGNLFIPSPDAVTPEGQIIKSKTIPPKDARAPKGSERAQQMQMSAAENGGASHQAVVGGRKPDIPAAEKRADNARPAEEKFSPDDPLLKTIDNALDSLNEDLKMIKEFAGRNKTVINKDEILQAYILRSCNNSFASADALIRALSDISEEVLTELGPSVEKYKTQLSQIKELLINECYAGILTDISNFAAQRTDNCWLGIMTGAIEPADIYGGDNYNIMRRLSEFVKAAPKEIFKHEIINKKLIEIFNRMISNYKNIHNDLSPGSYFSLNTAMNSEAAIQNLFVECVLGEAKHVQYGRIMGELINQLTDSKCAIIKNEGGTLKISVRNDKETNSSKIDPPQGAGSIKSAPLKGSQSAANKSGAPQKAVDAVRWAAALIAGYGRDAFCPKPLTPEGIPMPGISMPGIPMPGISMPGIPMPEGGKKRLDVKTSQNIETPAIMLSESNSKENSSKPADAGKPVNTKTPEPIWDEKTGTNGIDIKSFLRRLCDMRKNGKRYTITSLVENFKCTKNTIGYLLKRLKKKYLLLTPDEQSRAAKELDTTNVKYEKTDLDRAFDIKKDYEVFNSEARKLKIEISHGNILRLRGWKNIIQEILTSFRNAEESLKTPQCCESAFKARFKKIAEHDASAYIATYLKILEQFKEKNICDENGRLITNLITAYNYLVDNGVFIGSYKEIIEITGPEEKYFKFLNCEWLSDFKKSITTAKNTTPGIPMPGISMPATRKKGVQWEMRSTHNINPDKFEPRTIDLSASPQKPAQHHFDIHTNTAGPSLFPILPSERKNYPGINGWQGILMPGGEPWEDIKFSDEQAKLLEYLKTNPDYANNEAYLGAILNGILPEHETEKRNDLLLKLKKISADEDYKKAFIEKFGFDGDKLKSMLDGTKTEKAELKEPEIRTNKPEIGIKRRDSKETPAASPVKNSKKSANSKPIEMTPREILALRYSYNNPPDAVRMYSDLAAIKSKAQKLCESPGEAKKLRILLNEGLKDDISPDKLKILLLPDIKIRETRKGTDPTPYEYLRNPSKKLPPRDERGANGAVANSVKASAQDALNNNGGLETIGIGALAGGAMDIHLNAHQHGEIGTQEIPLNAARPGENRPGENRPGESKPFSRWKDGRAESKNIAPGITMPGITMPASKETIVFSAEETEILISLKDNPKEISSRVISQRIRRKSVNKNEFLSKINKLKNNPAAAETLIKILSFETQALLTEFLDIILYETKFEDPLDVNVKITKTKLFKPVPESMPEPALSARNLPPAEFEAFLRNGCREELQKHINNSRIIKYLLLAVKTVCPEGVDKMSGLIKEGYMTRWKSTPDQAEALFKSLIEANGEKAKTIIESFITLLKCFKENQIKDSRGNTITNILDAYNYILEKKIFSNFDKIIDLSAYNELFNYLGGGKSYTHNDFFKFLELDYLLKYMEELNGKKMTENKDITLKTQKTPSLFYIHWNYRDSNPN